MYLNYLVILKLCLIVKTCLYWLTGSQKFHLMKGITESLSGRVAIIHLLGLSQSELEKREKFVKPFLPHLKWIKKVKQKVKKNLSLMNVYKKIWTGSFPQVNQSKTNREIFYKSYIQRDARDILKITDENSFYRFLVAIAARIG